MRRSFRLAYLLFIVLPMTLAFACDGATAQPAYIGGAYSGSVKAEIDVGESVNKRQYGRATAEFRQLAPGRARLTVKGDIRGQSAGFEAEGNYDKSSFKAEEPDVELTIDAAGNISGRAMEEQSEYRLSGSISGAELLLVVQWRAPADAPSSAVRGVEFTYTLKSGTAAEGDKSAGPKGKDGKPCEKTRVEQRVFPSVDGGPMSMGMVVVCAD